MENVIAALESEVRAELDAEVKAKVAEKLTAAVSSQEQRVNDLRGNLSEAETKLSDLRAACESYASAGEQPVG